MTKIAKPEKKQNLALCLDGNKAYEKVSQALGLTFVKVDHVSHSAKEFHRKNGPNEAESGTLSIDAKWKSLCHFLGGGVRAKTKKWARNLWLGVLTFAWLHRHNLKQRSAETLRASFCKGCTVLSTLLRSNSRTGEAESHCGHCSGMEVLVLVLVLSATSGSNAGLPCLCRVCIGQCILRLLLLIYS